MECIIYPDKWCWNTFVKDLKPKVWQKCLFKVWNKLVKFVHYRVVRIPLGSWAWNLLWVIVALFMIWCSPYNTASSLHSYFLSWSWHLLDERCVCSSNSCSNFLSSRRDPFSIFAFPILQLEIFQFMICVAFTFLCICVFVFVGISSSECILPANLRLYGVSVLWSVWLLVEAFYRDATPRWACSWKK